jgi:hypothetical protein
MVTALFCQWFLLHPRGWLMIVPGKMSRPSQQGGSFLLTEWDLYRELDYRRIYSTMSKPAFLFDGRNILDHKAGFDIGFNVYPVGKAPLTHFA